MAKRLPRDPRKEHAILKAAMHEFAKNGYTQTSTDEIAKIANLSKGSVFRYFKNKKNLYIQTVYLAMDTTQQAADFTVWTDSSDLIQMILRATKYKIELSAKYPDEFTLLIDVYRQNVSIPADLRQKVFAIFDKYARENAEKLVTPVLNRLKLRTDIDKKNITAFVNLYIQQIGNVAENYMKAHPEVKTIEDMSELIAQLRDYMEMMEHGIVEK